MSRSGAPEAFYVGHAARAPKALAAFVRGRVVLAAAIVAAAALALAAAQRDIEPSRFEFGTTRVVRGVVRTVPYPMLEVDGTGPDGVRRVRSYLLAGAGKHSAAPLLAGAEGVLADVQGSLAAHGSHAMLEVTSAPVSVADAPASPAEVRWEMRGSFTLEGEIVDAKCYMGVMNPATGEVHRACMRRCLGGGIPPLFVVRDAHGREVVLLLTHDGRAVPRNVLRLGARPVRITGDVRSRAGFLYLDADPSTYEVLP